MPVIEIPIPLSYDTRNTDAYNAIGRDQRRVNLFYEIERGVVPNNLPRVALVRRPGCTEYTGTYGASGQTQYVICPDPTAGWQTPLPWVFTKNASNQIKVFDFNGADATVLVHADFYPRFASVVNVDGVETVVLQLQNTNGLAAQEGPPSQRVFIASTIGGFSEISDSDFVALKLRGKIVFMDGFAFVATGNGRLHQSNVNSLETWEPADYLTKGITQDATQGLMQNRNQILMAGRETCEIFTNQGNEEGSVLERLPYATHRVGLANTAGADASLPGKTDYFTAVGSVIFFVGRMGGGRSSVNAIAWNGQRFEKVSRTYEDKLLSSLEIFSVSKIPFFGKIAVAFQFTAPGVSPQKSLIFVPDVNDWFEWESTVFSPVNNGVQFLGTSHAPTKLYHFPLSNNYQDAGQSFDSYVQLKIPRNGRRQVMNRFGIIADTIAANDVDISFSDNDGASFGTERSISLATDIKEIFNCGMYVERMVKIKHNDSGEFRIHGIYADIVQLPF